MKARVIKHAVDGVAIGGVVELVDNVANRALVAAGVVEPLEALPEQPPAKAFKPAAKGDLRAAEDLQRRFDLAWEEAQGQIASLRAENAELRAALLAAAPADAAPSRAKKGG